MVTATHYFELLVKQQGGKEVSRRKKYDKNIKEILKLIFRIFKGFKFLTYFFVFLLYLSLQKHKSIFKKTHQDNRFFPFYNWQKVRRMD